MSIYFPDLMALGMFFIYQLEIFKYAGEILTDARIHAIKLYFFALVNCLLLIICIDLPVRHAYIYGIIVIVLAIEFKLLTKARWLQVFCGSSIFAMNIAAITLPVVAIAGRLTSVAPADIFQSAQYRGIVIFCICFILPYIIMPIVKKFFSTLAIRHVTDTGKYSFLLLVSVLGIVLFESVFVATIFGDIQYDAQLLLAIFTSAFVLVSFYYLFGYSCTLLNSTYYQKQSAALVHETQRLEDTKAVLNEKMERDALTGLYNRRYIISFLEELIENKNDGFTVLFVDINALKATNDYHGHAAGDRLIGRVAHVLSTVVREQDAVARVGGDEFVVVLTSETPDTAEKILTRINICLEKETQEEEFSVSASVGALYADSSIQSKGVDYILSRADEEMRINKKQFYS